MQISWPPRYDADRVAVRVSNEITINAAPDIVWRHLTAAADWPGWYPNSADVRIDSGMETLAAGAAFTWRTFGITVRSHVREFKAPERIAWDGKALLLDVYHAWLIEPRAGGCWVLTEEHQNGLAARAQALFMPNRMHQGHALWLRQLKQKSEA
jgi:uncharacterized protein YndB with AHSA1/START domain